MDQGLAHQMTYGSGQGQNTTHYYSGAKAKVKSKSKKQSKKSTKK